MPREPIASHARNSSVMSILQIAGFALALIVSGATAQIQGESGELCSCSPTVFSFKLDLAASCPGNLEGSDGIIDIACTTTVLAEDTSNEQPVLVDTVTILELNMNEVINSTTLSGPFLDGDVITYASISSYANLTDTYFPFSITLILTAENSDGVTVVNAVSIDYTNECDVWPVYPPDATIGWVGIVSQSMFERKECC
jgi:hypothetical protein